MEATIGSVNRGQSLPQNESGFTREGEAAP